MKTQFRFFVFIIFTIFFVFLPSQSKATVTPQYLETLITNDGSSDAIYPQQVALDNNGNVYLLGHFSGSVDFNIIDGGDLIASTSSSDIYLTKINSDGSYNQTFVFRGDGSKVPYAVATDTFNNVYVTGTFDDEIFLDPSGGVASNTLGGDDNFLVKLDSDGDYVYGYTWGSTNSDTSAAMVIDSADNVYVGGQISGNADLDPTGGTANFTAGANDAYFIKLNSVGAYVFARVFSGGVEAVKSLVTDSNNNLFVAGFFRGTTDFDPSGSTANKTSSSSGSINSGFVSKFNDNGIFQSNITINGTGSDGAQVYTMTRDSNNNIYATGYYQGTADLDTLTADGTFTNNGLYDVYVAKFDNDLDYQFGRTFGGTNYEYILSIGVDNLDNVYMFGATQSGSIDFDPNGGGDIHSQPTPSSYSSILTGMTSDGDYNFGGIITAPNNNNSYDGHMGGGLFVSDDDLYTTIGFRGAINFNPFGSDVITPDDNTNSHLSYTRYLLVDTPSDNSQNNDNSSDEDDNKKKKKVCRATTPPQPTWVKLKPATVNGVRGMQLNWVQYSADKITLNIDDGSGTFPWLTDKIVNDGNEFIPNVASSQQIKIKAYNGCKGGPLSDPVSFNAFPRGWFKN